jgi:hypothetical protein
VPLDSEDFENDLLAAKERDLSPLREESQEVLDLDYEQMEAMEDFLDLAWSAGIRSGQAQMEARATQREPNIPALAIKHFEADFRELMEDSASTLSLSLHRTVDMWGILHRAWMAGNRTCEAEMMGLYLELKSDVTEEARRWLESGERGGN